MVWRTTASRKHAAHGVAVLATACPYRINGNGLARRSRGAAIIMDSKCCTMCMKKSWPAQVVDG